MRCELFKDRERRLRLRWSCPLCAHRWDFHLKGAEDIGFFVVHHLVGKHGLSLGQLIAYDRGLVDPAREYLGYRPRDREVLAAQRAAA